MKRFKKILYLYDIDNDNHSGLKYADELAQSNNATLSIFFYSEYAVNLLKKHLENMQENVGSFLGMTLHTKVAQTFSSKSKSRQEIIDVIEKNNFDLVITEAKKVSPISKFFYGTAVLSLLRHSPVPAWVVCGQAKENINNVMIAVDPIDTKPGFTDKILSIGSSLSKELKAKAQIVHAWECEEEKAYNNPFLQLNKKDIQESVKKTKKVHSDALDDALKRNNITTNASMKTVLLKGNKKNELVKFVRDNNIDLIVIGIKEKNALEGAIFGRTVESLVYHVDCSIFAIKP